MTHNLDLQLKHNLLCFFSILCTSMNISNIFHNYMSTPHGLYNIYLIYDNNVIFFGIDDFHLLFQSGGRIIRVSGQNLDVVQEPKMRVILSPPESLPPRRKRRLSSESKWHDHDNPLKKQRRTVLRADCFEGTLCHLKQVNIYVVAKKVNHNCLVPIGN